MALNKEEVELNLINEATKINRYNSAPNTIFPIINNLVRDFVSANDLDITYIESLKLQ